MRRSRPMHRTWKIALALLALTLQLGMQMAIPARAMEQIDTGRLCTLTVSDVYETKPLAGRKFAIYAVGQVSATADLTLLPDFSGSGVELQQLQESGKWNAAAQRLQDFVQEETLQPLQTQTADQTGRAVFSDLPVGLYLLLGEDFSASEGSYRCAPALLLLPNAASDAADWGYAVTVQPKDQFTPRDAQPQQPDTPPADGKLPQTGQLKWPVPVLAAAGLLLLLFGLLLRRAGRNPHA